MPTLRDLDDESRRATVHLLALAVAADRDVNPAEIAEYEEVLDELFADRDAAMRVSRQAFLAAGQTGLPDLATAIVRHASAIQRNAREAVLRLVARIVASDGEVVDIEDGVLTLLADAFELTEDERVEAIRSAVEDDLGFADRPL